MESGEWRVCYRTEGEGDGTTDPRSEDTRLAECLTVELVNPLGRTVGGDNDERVVLIVGLGNGWQHIEQGGARRDADNDRLVGGLSDAQGIEGCRTFVGDRVTGDVRTLVQVVYYRSIPTARTDHGIADAVSYKQGGEDVNTFVRGVHGDV